MYFLTHRFRASRLHLIVCSPCILLHIVTVHPECISSFDFRVSCYTSLPCILTTYRYQWFRASWLHIVTIVSVHPDCTSSIFLLASCCFKNSRHLLLPLLFMWQREPNTNKLIKIDTAIIKIKNTFKIGIVLWWTPRHPTWQSIQMSNLPMTSKSTLCTRWY